MKTKTVICGVALLAIGMATASRAALLPSWTFDGSNTIQPDSTIAPDSGNGTLTVTGTGISISPSGGNQAGYLSMPSGGGGSIDLQFSGSGTGFKLNYDAIADGSLKEVHWFWSMDIDNDPFHSLADPSGSQTVTSTWTSYTADFSAVDFTGGTIYLEGNVSSGPPSLGFDNISAVPEPINAALLIFALSAAGTGVGRRVLARSGT